ncbi:hypothetical protein CKAH01_00122 [Colletotrichum kahawae]|uniref:Uncharacterized protein n=1 Tax=Colletotrichum kahawae TaxID=34407 RepID=A0AAE0DCT2_COLKA|nr:hypothetical protein CKAH01_00122 [Colletotrichum kahawae]
MSDNISNKAIVNGDISFNPTGAHDDAANMHQQQRIDSFLTDKNGPVPLFGQTKSSIVRRRNEKNKIIEDIVSKVHK